MKKVKIITIHCIHNFGSVFQSYALVKYLCNKGYDAEIIDYRPAYYSKGRNAFKNFMSHSINAISYAKQHKKYQDFINEELPKTNQVFKSFDDLRFFENEDAIFIAGGDQIWNTFHPCGRDDAYKLTFAKKGFKIASGTSMGRNTFSSDELKDLAQKVADLYSIGLRESSTVAMFQPYTSVPVYHTSDPVLLLDKQDYMSFVGEKPIIKEPYVLVYLASNKQLLNESVSYIAKSLGLKVVHANGFRKKCDCDYFLKSSGPKDLLNLIYYSDFVVSASFHATLFSLLFEKQFGTLLPEAGTNTRIEDLLNYFGLSNRIIRNDAYQDTITSAIDFSLITPKLNAFSERSRNQLNEAINGSLQ